MFDFIVGILISFCWLLSLYYGNMLMFDFIVGILISFSWLLSLYYNKGHDQKPCSEERVCWVYMPIHSPSLRETKTGTEAETLEEYYLKSCCPWPAKPYAARTACPGVALPSRVFIN